VLETMPANRLIVLGGFKDGKFVTWYSSEKQAELAQRYGKIDSFEPMSKSHAEKLAHK
jgi:hypothetical protein